MKITAPLFVCILLAGCAPTIQNASENGVVIMANNDYAAQTQTMADAECKKFGKSARLNQAVPANVAASTYFFDCR